MTKGELREAYLAKRKALDDTRIEHLSRQICDRFLQDIGLSDIQVIHTYLPMSRNNEPDTWPIIRFIQESALPVRISIPKISASTDTLNHFFLDSKTGFETNRWGIVEPTSGQVTPVSEIDLVVVPLLIFDIAGQRVGYGKGFYDRFLNKCRPDTKRVGVSFFPPVERIDDINEWDVPLDYCVTPDRTFTFIPEAPADSGNERIQGPR